MHNDLKKYTKIVSQKQYKYFNSFLTSLAMASACLNCDRTTVFSVVCVISVTRYCTGSPKM